MKRKAINLLLSFLVKKIGSFSTQNFKNNIDCILFILRDEEIENKIRFHKGDEVSENYQ